MTDITKKFLSQAEYVSLPKEHREKLREVFNIPKSGQVRVQSTPNGDKLVSDGVEPEDLMKFLNLENCLKFLGHELKEGALYGFDVVFQEVLKKLFPNSTFVPPTPKEEPKIEIPQSVSAVQPKVSAKKITIAQKKVSRKSK